MQVTISRDNWLYVQEGLQRLREKNPQSSFSDGIERAVANAEKNLTSGEVLDKLSERSVQLLQKMKAGSRSVSSTDWNDLVTELKDLGAITQTDYSRIPRGGTKIVSCESGDGYLCFPADGQIIPMPVPTGGLTHYAPGEERMDDVLDGLYDWPGDPLEKLENLALYMRKWIGVLGVSKDDKGNPGSWYSGPFEQYEASYLNVLKSVKELLAAV